MTPADARPEDLITAQQAERDYGIPGYVLRQWATRGRIARYPGRWRSQPTMYARQHVEQLAPTYKPRRARAA